MPIVDGLEKDYGDRVAFRQVDAGDPRTRGVLATYQVRGHPTFVVLNAEGEVIARRVGESGREPLERAIIDALSNQ